MQKQKNGFSLIELMFVMVVFAAMGLYAVNLMKNRQHKLAIAQSVTQFKNLLHQGLLYQQNTNTLPNSSQDLLDANYIQAADLCSSWTNAGSGNGACPKKATYQVTNLDKQTIVVSLVLPTIDNSAAAAIASQIPSGQFDVSTGTIKGLALVQIQPELYTDIAKTNRFGFLTNAGMVKCDNKKGYDKTSDCYKFPLASPSCPIGYEGHFILSPYQFTSDRRQTGGSAVSKSQKHYWITSFTSTGEVVNPQSDNPTFLVSDSSGIINTGKSNTDYGSNIAVAQYLVMCVPAGKWSSAASSYSIPGGIAKVSQVPFITRDKLNCPSGASDPCLGQCNKSWYNAYPCDGCGSNGYPNPLGCGKIPR